MSDTQENHMEVNAQFIDQINFVQSVFNFAKIDAKIYLNGPITIPIACDDIVRAKAGEMGIETTSVGIVFIIEKMEDFLVAMEQFRTLFYSASDLAGRIPDGFDFEKAKEGTNKFTTWIKGLVDRFKTN